MFRIGLTGGIASGKTTVADTFGELGATLIDTDIIAREIVAPESEGLEAVVDVFGNAVLTDDGALDRRKMREIVFADKQRRSQLEAILHPRIRDEVGRRMALPDGPYQVIVVPLLVESPLRHAVDRILVVDCPQDVQLARLLHRDAESREQALKIIASQTTRDERLAIADDVVDNSGDIESMIGRVTALHDKYMALAKSRD